MSRPVLGISVGASEVRAVLWWRAAIRWAGTAAYDDAEALADAVARLAGEAGMPVRRARVVLERDVVQLRTIIPAPPLDAKALRGYVTLEAPRLFRKNGAPLVTDGVRVPVNPGSDALWAGACAEPLVRAVGVGCAQAGLTLESVGPAADVLPSATTDAGPALAFPNGGATELLELAARRPWRSRLVPLDPAHRTPKLVPPLAGLGAGADHFTAAYGAAVTLPRLSLLPPDVRAAHDRAGWRRLLRIFAAGAVLWALAAALYVGRLGWTRHTATRALEAAAPAVDSALAVRRQRGLAEATLATVANAEQTRSRHLALLAAVTAALRDSMYLVAFQVTADGTVRLAGYAPVAARVVADLERVPRLANVQLEGPVTREGARDRFAIVARLEPSP